MRVALAKSKSRNGKRVVGTFTEFETGKTKKSCEKEQLNSCSFSKE